jgi:outer membrane usher protein FimD/PapC
VFQANLANRYGVAGIRLRATEDAGDPRITRLDTAWTAALPGQREALRLGDSVDQAGAWGHPLRFGGLQYGTDLDRGAAFAAPQEVMQPSRTAFALTPPGTVDHTCAIGFLRSNYGLDGDRYGPAFASATLRAGISENLTTEFRGGAQEGVGNGGVALVARVSGLGTLSAATAASRGDSGSGRLAQTGFEYRHAGLSASIQAQWASSEFRQLGVAAEGVPPRYWSVARAAYDAARHGVFGMGYAALARYDETLTEAAEATYRVAFGRASTLTLSLSRTFEPEPDTSLMLVLSFPLDPLGGAGAATTRRAANGVWTFGRSAGPLSLSPFDEG